MSREIQRYERAVAKRETRLSTTKMKWCDKCKRWDNVWQEQEHCLRCDGRLRES